MAPDNNLGPFTCYYPAVGLCTIIYYFWFIEECRIALNQDLKTSTTVGLDTIWETRVKDIIHKYDWSLCKHTEFNLCESAAIYKILPKWYKPDKKSCWTTLCCEVKDTGLYAKSKKYKPPARDCG